MRLQLKKKLNLSDIVSSKNVATMLKEKDLAAIANEVISSFEQDKSSRDEWSHITEKALDLIELKHEMKNTPYPNASNVKYPLISTAVIQFAARQMPLIIRQGKVVEAQRIGADPFGEKEAKAKRVSSHMSYQCLYEMYDWEEGMDKLFHVLASVGVVFKKTYRDPVKNRNVSEVCLHDEIFIHEDVKCLEDARRVTHRIYLHSNDIVERMRMGIYSEFTKDELERQDGEGKQEDNIHEVLEQHRYLDLDKDGYEEPYIVLVDRSVNKVLRIVARFEPEDVYLTDDDKVLRIVPTHFFTDFHFIRSPRGKFYSIGFGQLLYSLNHSINTTLNQLIDAGTLANTHTGFIDKRLKLGRDYKLSPGTFYPINLAGIEDMQKHIMPFNFKEPSTVLFQLMGTLIEATKEVSSVSDALTGREQAQNVAATTMLALIEQGNKVFSSVQKRIFMGLRKEFQKLFRLNRIYLDREEYYRVMDEEAVIHSDDYNEAELDIMPVADPSVSSDAHRVARTQALMPLIGQPGVNPHEILKRYMEDLETPNIDKILMPPDPNAPPPVEVLEKQSEIQERGHKIQLQAKELELRSMSQTADMLKKQAEIKLMEAQAIKAIADAEAVELGQQIEQYRLQVERLGQEMNARLDAMIQAKDPETNFRESDIEKVLGGNNGQSSGLEGNGLPMEEPPSDEVPIPGVPGSEGSPQG